MYNIGIIGLGYVGLPLAQLFATKYPVTGYDLNKNRVDELNLGNDRSLEVEADLLHAVLKPKANQDHGLYLTHQPEALKGCNVFIVTVPTPVTAQNIPDLSALESASHTVAQYLSKGSIVIYESTVYPGATQEVCLPILEQGSGLVFNQDFYLGYSPERINPGDKTKGIADIVKVTSGSTPEIAARIDALYASVITAGTYMAPSIKVAEAAKVIENAQRDINIAFVNELSQIFNLMDIDTKEVLAAAKTKWNFLDFNPGLVGGHCIGVDPYYLAHKAKSLGYTPNVILAGREINDGMARYVGQQIINKLEQGAIDLKKARILVLGITFKPNCPDIRNSKVVDLINYLLGQCASVTAADPWADPKQSKDSYGLSLTSDYKRDKFDVVVLAVHHREFLQINMDELFNDSGFSFDITSVSLQPKSK